MTSKDKYQEQVPKAVQKYENDFQNTIAHAQDRLNFDMDQISKNTSHYIRRKQKDISPKLKKNFDKLNDHVTTTVAQTTPKIHKGLQNFAPKVDKTVENAAPKIQNALDSVVPNIRKGKDKIVNTYIPGAAEKIEKGLIEITRGLKTAQLPEDVDLFMAKLGGNKREIRKATKAASRAHVKADKIAKKQTEQLTREIRKASGNSSHKGVLIVGLLVTGAIAAGAAWKASQPVDNIGTGLPDEQGWKPLEIDL